MKPFFAGRETDIQRLMVFAEEAFAGKTSVAFITGEAGIGKTALAEELIYRLQSKNHDIVVACGKCTVKEASYLPFRTILENLVTSEKRFIGDREKSRKFFEVVFDTIWTAGPDLMGIFGIPIKGLQSAVEKHGLRTKKQVRETIIPKDLDPNQIYGWYTKIIQEISEKFSLVLFLDDLHWADESSLNLLFHLGHELENRKIFLIASYRPHDVNPDSRLLDIKTRLERYGAQEFPLDVSEEKAEDILKIREFIHAYLTGKYGTVFSERFESLLADRTEGNALFLTEILKNMEEKGQIVSFQQDADGKQTIQWKLAKEIENIEQLPKKIEVVIRERIDRLEKGLRDILTYASIEGDDFFAQVIAKARLIDEWTLIDELTEKLMNMFHLIWERGGKSLPNGNRVHEFSFCHNLLREYVYSQIPKSKKEHLHAQIGECLERLYEPNANEIAGTLAVHFKSGYVFSKTVSYSLKAAQDANSRYGTAEAVRFAEMGIEALEKCKKTMPGKEYAEIRVQLLIELAKAEEFGGNPQEKKDHIQAGIAILEENLSLLHLVSEKLQAEFYVELGKLYNRKGNKYQEAKTHLEKALSLYEKSDKSKEVAEICYVLGNIYQFIPSSSATLSPLEQSIAVLNKGLYIGEQLHDTGLQSKILSRLAWRYGQKDFSIAEKYAKQALDFSRSRKGIERHTEINPLISMAYIYRRYVKQKTSIRYLEEALEIARQLGNIFAESEILNDLGFDYMYFVTLKSEAQCVLEKSITIRDRIGSKKTSPLSNLGWIFAEQGKWKEAKSCWQKAISEASEKSQSLYQYYMGRLYTFQGKYAQAEGIFLYRIHILEKYQSSSILLYVRTAQNYARLGNETESKKFIEIANTLFKKESNPDNKAEYLYEQAETWRALGKFDLAKASCQKSLIWFLNNAEDVENYKYVARVRLVMGKILVDMQKYQESIEYLNKAKNAFAIGKHYALGETMLYLGKPLSPQPLQNFRGLNYPEKSMKQKNYYAI